MSLILDAAPDVTAPPDLLGFDHLEWWVGNARHSAHYWASAFGFEIEAYAGPETGLRDRMSYVVRQGDVRFVLTSSLDDHNDIARFVAEHGDGVRDVAYAVGDAALSYDRLCARGAIGVEEPTTSRDDSGQVVRATVGAYGETRHSVIERGAYAGVFLPGYESVDAAVSPSVPLGIHHADHVVANVAAGDLDRWVEWYERVFGFRQLQHFDEGDISTQYSALRSTVVSNGAGVVLPINEPAPGRGKSQIEEYLDYFGCPGVQHVALHTTDILSTVAGMRRRGVRFMRVPSTYYDDAPGRLAGLDVDLPWGQLAELGILVDRDASGYLLQVFTEPVASRPTAFMEIIQREGARGFGEGNFKALFESIETEQARRGNL